MKRLIAAELGVVIIVAVFGFYLTSPTAMDTKPIKTQPGSVYSLQLQDAPSKEIEHYEKRLTTYPPRPALPDIVYGQVQRNPQRCYSCKTNEGECIVRPLQYTNECYGFLIHNSQPCVCQPDEGLIVERTMS